jgi:hypothetical protein
MDTNKNNGDTTQLSLRQNEMRKINFFHVPVKIEGRDIRLNVSFMEAIIRFGVLLLLPIVMLLVNAHLIIYTAPVMAYLFVSGLTHFCIIKYAWRRYIMHQPPAALPPYGENPDYPEESV